MTFYIKTLSLTQIHSTKHIAQTVEQGLYYQQLKAMRYTQRT